MILDDSMLEYPFYSDKLTPKQLREKLELRDDESEKHVEKSVDVTKGKKITRRIVWKKKKKDNTFLL